MLSKYQTWIDEHYPNAKSAAFMCQDATEKMVKAFPELIRVRGWCRGMEHWWCKTADGEVIDPTIKQWDLSATLCAYPEFDPSLPYREFREGVDPEPMGKCMNCGEYCWEKDPDTGEKIPGATSCSCSEACARALEAEYNTEIL